MDFFVKNDPKILVDGPTRRFWYKFACEAARLGRMYPTLKAEQKVRADGSEGEWIITGPPAGVHSFRELVVHGARKLGYHGGNEGAVQFWLDHANGKHLIRRSNTQRREDQREAMVTLAGGIKEKYVGRQRKG